MCSVQKIRVPRELAPTTEFQELNGSQAVGDVRDISGTRALAEMVAKADLSSLSPDDVRYLIKLVVDAIGCALGAPSLAPGQLYIEFAKQEGGRLESTILGTSIRASSSMAAWANAGLINTLDFDDTLLGHPGATTIGPAFALAEALGSSGIELLTALAAGYEASLRVSDSVRASVPRWRQVTSSATAQTFGAAAVAASLLKLDTETTATAFGLAASMAPVPSTRKFGTQDGGQISWTKNQYAAASKAGVLGARLAAAGAVGPTTILDGARGFWVMAGSDQTNPEALHRTPGSAWQFRNVALKPYPCCRFFHSAIDALRTLMTSTNLGRHGIKAIKVSSVQHLATFMNRRPESTYDAEFSLPYALALTAQGIPPGLGWFDSFYLNEPGTLALMDAVEVESSPRAEAAFRAKQPYTTRVTVIGEDGSKQGASVKVPRGHPLNPLSDGHLDEKFLSLAASAIGLERAHSALEGLKRLEEAKNVGSIFPMLARVNHIKKERPL